MIIWINESKTLTKIYHAIVNVGLMGKNLIHINGGTLISVDVTVKIAMYVKKIIV